jgi:nucleoside-diphosphate-sugar epimerase
MRILITGINSAVGESVADSFAEHEIIALGRKQHPRYRTIVCDLHAGVPRLPNIDLCLHMAFVTDPVFCREHYEDAYRVNVSATVSLLRRVPRFVLVSTGSVYGFHDGILDENRPPAPQDEYARMKYLAEQETLQHSDAMVLRYFFPYGPATKPGSVVNRLIDNIRCGRSVEVHAEGKPRINPIYISDLAAATKSFCLSKLKGICNVAGNDVVSIKELAERIGNTLGKQPVFRQSGKRLRNLVGCTERLRTTYKPIVSLADGITATVNYHRRLPTGSSSFQPYPLRSVA